MLDRHAVQKLLDAGVKPRAIAQQYRVSRRTIERIAREAQIRCDADGSFAAMETTPRVHPVGRASPRRFVAASRRWSSTTPSVRRAKSAGC
jgi:hypothetical protein